jgi:hypothetical protein
MDETTQRVPPVNLRRPQVIDRWPWVPDRRPKVKPAMRPRLVVMPNVGPKDALKVSSADDERVGVKNSDHALDQTFYQVTSAGPVPPGGTVRSEVSGLRGHVEFRRRPGQSHPRHASKVLTTCIPSDLLNPHTWGPAAREGHCLGSCSESLRWWSGNTGRSQSPSSWLCSPSRRPYRTGSGG